MSNQATQTKQSGFKTPEAKPRPTLFCIGYVGEVGDGHLSSSEKSLVNQINIEAVDAGTPIRAYFCYRPEWLVPGFDPAVYKDVEDGASAIFSYEKNIVSGESNSLLRGLAGSQEAFEKLATALQALPVEPGDDGPSLEAVDGVLRSFFENNTEADGSPKRIGYTLVQQTSDTGETDENGKKIYRREPYYKISSYWDVTEKNIKAKVKMATKEPDKKKVTFEAGVPF